MNKSLARPKNLKEALHVIKAWNSRNGKWSDGGYYGALNKQALTEIERAVKGERSIQPIDVLEVIAGLDTKLYNKVEPSLLYALRLLTLLTVKDKPNGKEFLRKEWITAKPAIEKYIAPKMYKLSLAENIN